MSKADTEQETVRVLSEFWAEVLDQDAIQPTDRILDLGGDSLVATMVANRIELTWGFRPTMEELLTLSLRDLSVLCEQRRTG